MRAPLSISPTLPLENTSLDIFPNYVVNIISTEDYCKEAIPEQKLQITRVLLPIASSEHEIQ